MAVSNVFGALGIPDDDYTYVLTFGQEAIYDATMALLGNHNDDLRAAETVFVEAETTAHTARYYLSTGGRLEKVGNDTRPSAQKAAAKWDVAFPLEEFGTRLQGNRVQMAYMTAGQYGRHIQSILNSDVNTRRHEMLKRIFNNGGGSPITFQDENWGALSLQPLANGDSTVYPPVVGSEVNATANNYLTASYATTAISDTNDPLKTVVDQIEQYFGIPTAGSNIVIFCGKTDSENCQKLLTLFNPIEYRFQKLGDNITEAVNFPLGLPGRLLGEYAGKCLLVQWRWIPDNYFFGIHLDAPKPLKRRIDPPGTGLTPGLQLRQTTILEPFVDSIWTNRFGYAVGNRLNGVVLEINQGGSYTVPTGYSD